MRNIEGKLAVGVIVLWVLSALASLAVTVGIVIVAIHFIQKFW